MGVMLLVALFMHTGAGLASVYFIFGAAGTLCRIALSPTIELGVNRRTIVEGIVGGVAGYVLPYFGAFLAARVGLDAATVEGAPVIFKGGLMFLLAYSGSFSVGELLARKDRS